MTAHSADVWLDDGDVKLYAGDALEQLALMPSESVQCIVTSPPFWGLRDYGMPGQIGLEETPDEWCQRLVAVMREARRVLRSDGVCWIEVGDTYAGSWGNQGRKEERGTQRPVNGGMLTPVHDDRYPSKASNTGAIPEGCDFKPKDLVGAPWLLAFALRADGWYLRAEQIWHKVNPMPESVTDRPTRGHSTVFLLSKSARYYFDADAIREGEGSGRNARSVWSLASEPFSARALDCGTHYKASPDCPIHGLDADPQSWEQAARDEQPAEARLHRIDSTRARHALAQQAELASTQSRTSETRSSATPHSTQSRRTGLAPSTTEPCTPSGETSHRTAGTPETPASAAPHASTPASSNGSDGSLEAAPSADTPRHTSRKCSCEKHTVDHFATFPQALVERCILAGTSERGACSECGAPWRRITERDRVVTGKYDTEFNAASSATAGSRDTNYSTRGVTTVETLGWEPSCEHGCPCGHDDAAHATPGTECSAPGCDCPHAPYVVPCVVLDMFSGSGTTALVARRLGRHAVGIELNAEYLAISAKRLQQLSLFSTTGADAPSIP